MNYLYFVVQNSSAVGEYSKIVNPRYIQQVPPVSLHDGATKILGSLLLRSICRSRKFHAVEVELAPLIVDNLPYYETGQYSLVSDYPADVKVSSVCYVGVFVFDGERVWIEEKPLLQSSE